MKSVQCGITVYLEVTAIAEMMRNHFVLAGFPNDTDRNEFVHVRFDRLFNSVPLYRYGRMQAGRAANRTVDSVSVKLLFGGGIKAVSTNRKTAFKSTTAQCILIDEVDACDLKNLEYAEDRTAATKLLTGEEPIKRRVGNPTVPGEGIHLIFTDGDNKWYNIKCARCNEWQYLDWFKHIVTQVDLNHYELLDRKWKKDSPDDINAICKYCNRPLDRYNTNKEWIAEYPTRTQFKSTYQISQLFTEQFSIRQLFSSFNSAIYNPTRMQVFVNSKLGLPFEGTGEQLTKEKLDACVDNDWRMVIPKDYRHGAYVSAGTDVGKKLHTVISWLHNGMRYRIYIGAPTSWEELSRLYARYNVRHAVIDAMPDLHASRKFQREHSNILIYLCEYNKSDKIAKAPVVEVERYEPGMGDIPTKLVQANRTEIIDAMVEQYNRELVVLPRGYDNIDNGDFLSHMIAPARLYDEKMRRNIWTENGRPDHYFHADVYDYIAAKKAGFGEQSYAGEWV
jgi:hypothetical protein